MTVVQLTSELIDAHEAWLSTIDDASYHPLSDGVLEALFGLETELASIIRTKKAAHSESSSVSVYDDDTDTSNGSTPSSSKGSKVRDLIFYKFTSPRSVSPPLLTPLRVREGN